MKKIFTMAAVLMLLAVLAFGAAVSSGFGKSLTATTTPQLQQVGDSGGDYGMYLRITVTGSEPVRFMWNTTTAGFVGTNAVVVNPGFPETYYTGDPFYSIVYDTASSTSAFSMNVWGRQ